MACDVAALGRARGSFNAVGAAIGGDVEADRALAVGADAAASLGFHFAELAVIDVVAGYLDVEGGARPACYHSRALPRSPWRRTLAHRSNGRAWR